MKRPKISICAKRKGVKIGCFDETDCIRDFIFYEIESEGVSEAMDFFRKHGVTEPEIIRPKITKMVLRS